MYQAGFQQEGDDLETTTLGDLRGYYWSKPIATNDPGHAADLAIAHSLPSGYPPPSATSLPLSPAHTDSSLILRSVGYADFSSYPLPPAANLPSGSAYDLNHTEFLDFEEAPADSWVQSSACIGYCSQANELSLAQPQSDYGDIFPVDFPNYELFDLAIPPLNSANRECQHPASEQNFEQNNLLWLQHQSNPAYQSGLRHDDSNHMPLGFGQILGADLAPVKFNSRRCARCQQLKKKVFIFP
jgi:hypothetical protein